MKNAKEEEKYAKWRILNKGRVLEMWKEKAANVNLTTNIPVSILEMSDQIPA
jgi:hypothetical protein